MPLILQERVSLKSLNTFGVDGRAAWFARAHSVEDLACLRADARLRDLPWLVLGGGSNVLPVGDIEAVVVQVAIPGVADAGRDGAARLVRVGAGEPWAALVERLVADGRPGLENLALIPGLAGAAPIQNIGAYGLELAERLHAVTVWHAADAGLRELPVHDCGFGYRDSVFKRDRSGARIVVGLTLRLPDPWQAVTGYAELERELAARGCVQPGPSDIFDTVCTLRRRKLPDPARLGNAGSFFKNPVVDRARHAELIERFPSMVSYPLAGGRYKLGAAWMIEACGLRGYTRGRAAVFEGQALVLVNRGGASGADILALARDVQERVRHKFGVTLEPEVCIVGAQHPAQALLAD